MSVERCLFPRHKQLWPLVAVTCPPGELAHDAEHIFRVYAWTLTIAAAENVDQDTAGAAALVHDLVFIPKNSVDRAKGGEMSAAAAPTLLAQVGYAAADMVLIADAVRTSSWSRGLAPTNPIGAVLQDADRLDALGAIGLMRMSACAQHMSRAEQPGNLYDPMDAAAQNRALDDRRYAIDHCSAKLLKLSVSMHSPLAQAEAARRHAFIEAFVAELQREVVMPAN